MDEQRQKWVAELTEAIFELIVARSPKTTDDAIIDQHACIEAMLRVDVAKRIEQEIEG
jgi:hypothetical protein